MGKISALGACGRVRVWRMERRAERMMEEWRSRRMGRKEERRDGKMEGWKDEGMENY